MLKYLFGFLKKLFNPAVSPFAKIDDRSRISHKARVYGWTQVNNSTMGDYSYVGRNSRIVYADIGKFCSIASETKIGMGTHTLDLISTSPLFTEKKNGTGHSWIKKSVITPFNRVSIGNDVWIGVRAMVMGGITIGDGVVIGAGSIVTKDIPPYAVVAGVPARIIRYRFLPEQIDALLRKPWWDIPDEELKKRISLFQNSERLDETINELCDA